VCGLSYSKFSLSDNVIPALIKFRGIDVTASHSSCTLQDADCRVYGGKQ